MSEALQPPDDEAKDLLEFAALERQLEAVEMEQDLKTYIPKAWPHVEPSRFVPNWHVDAIADHLSAISSGCIKYLLITMPPRHSKSLLVSVLWPTWEWISKPNNRWVFASYSFSLSVRDSVKRRNLVQSKWYQQYWAYKFSLLKEQNSKVRFANSEHGFMLASSVGGSNTGEGGERIVADDPHNVKKAESEDVRQDTVNWWNVVMSTRRNDASAARVVVQQRVHEGDVAGSIIEAGEVTHLNLPAEFVPTRRCFTSWVTPERQTITWSDPRQELGDLLNPNRFSKGQLDLFKLELGDYQYAAQFQQDPTPPEGQIIQAAWIKYYGGTSGVPVPDWTKTTNPMCPLFSLDCAFKKHDDTDFVAGLAFAMFGADIYILPQVIHARLSFTGTLYELVKFVGGKDLKGEVHPGVYPFIKLKVVEDKANGSAIIDTLAHQVTGLVPFEPRGDSKESRLQAVSWRFRAGNVYLPHESIAPWVAEYVYELCAFPKAKKDDYVDATSQALLFIGGNPQVAGAPVGSDHTSTWGVGSVGGGHDAPHLGRNHGGSEGGVIQSAFISSGPSIWRK